MISVAQWWFLLEFARDLFSDLSSLLSSTQRNFQDVLADKKDKILGYFGLFVSARIKVSDGRFSRWPFADLPTLIIQMDFHSAELVSGGT